MVRATAALAAIAGGLILIVSAQPSDTPSPTSGDALTQSYRADRAARSQMLRDMASREFRNDEEQAAWHTEQSRRIISESFRPYLDAVAEAIVSGTLEELADELEDEP